MSMQAVVERMIRPLRNRVYTIITRAVLETVRDDEKMQLVKLSLLAGESRSDVERFQNFGVTSHPLPGAEAVAVAVGGNRDHLIVIATDDRRFRIKDLPAGGVAIYSAVEGENEAKQIIKVLPDGNIELGKGTLEKLVNGETFKVEFEAHTHIGNLLAPTGPPILPLTSAALSSKVKAET